MANGLSAGSESLLSTSRGFAAVSGRARPLDARDLGADHHAREALGALLLRVGGGDQLAAAQDRGAARERQHFGQPVRDVEDRDALGRKPPQRDEEEVRLLRRQHRRRLVHDDEPRLLQQAAHDLDPLPLADGKVGDAGVGIERQAVFARHLADRLGKLAAAARRQRQRDVLGDGQRLEQRKVLEHHADAEPARLRRVGDRHRLAFPEDAALVRRKRAVEHLHQRRLAGAVLAEQRVDLAVADIEADVVAGRERAEALGQPLRREQAERRGSGRHPGDTA